MSSDRKCELSLRIWSNELMPIVGRLVASSLGTNVPLTRLATSASARGANSSPRLMSEAATSSALHCNTAGLGSSAARCDNAEEELSTGLTCGDACCRTTSRPCRGDVCGRP